MSRWVWFGLVILFSTHLMAQQAIDPPAQVPPGISPVGSTGRFRLNFRNASLDTVLYELADAFGLSIIKTSPLANERVGSIVNLTGVTEDDALTLINIALNDLGQAAIRKGNVLHIQPRTEAMTRDIPVRRYVRPEDVLRNDELVTAVIPLRSTSATQLVNSLRPLVSSDTTIAADASANALIVTDVTSTIHRIVSIVSELEAHSASATEVAVIKLEHANPADVARMLNDIYRRPPPATPTGGRNGNQAGSTPTPRGRGNRGG